VSLIFLLFSIVLIYFLARRIANPIVQLAEEATRIRNFDLEEEREVKTNIYELQLLNDSIIAMRQSMRAFAKFIPKVLVGKLIKSHQEVRIGGKKRRATLLFTDVANFTTVCEGYPADSLVVHLSEYFEEITQIIMLHQGTVDKYIGDAVMAFWGAPISDKDQAFHACAAALALQKRLGELNRKWQAENKPVLITRIGMHIGEVIVGNMGSTERMNYTALGDTVNLAARLEGVNKVYHTNIIISEEIYNEIGKRCLTRPLDVVTVKGKTKGVKIYELVGILEGNSSLFPSQEQMTFCKLFEKGFQLYLERRWDEAVNTFEEIHKQFGTDYTTAMYIERCQKFKENPPPENWDGVEHLTSK
jgi:adenylate cyclase